MKFFENGELFVGHWRPFLKKYYEFFSGFSDILIKKCVWQGSQLIRQKLRCSFFSVLFCELILNMTFCDDLTWFWKSIKADPWKTFTIVLVSRSKWWTYLLKIPKTSQTKIVNFLWVIEVYEYQLKKLQDQFLSLIIEKIAISKYLSFCP